MSQNTVSQFQNLNFFEIAPKNVPSIFLAMGPNFEICIIQLNPLLIMWQSFTTIGRERSDTSR